MFLKIRVLDEQHKSFVLVIQVLYRPDEILPHQIVLDVEGFFFLLINLLKNCKKMFKFSRNESDGRGSGRFRKSLLVVLQFAAAVGLSRSILKYILYHFSV